MSSDFSNWSNPMTQQFRIQDLNDSTFAAFALSNNDSNGLALPDLSRDLSSTSFNLPSSSQTLDLDSSNNNNPIPPPFTPLRGLSNVEMSLAGLNDLSNVNLSNYDFNIPENFMSAVQASNTNSDQFAMAMNYPSSNPNEFNFMTNSVTNTAKNNISSAVYNNSSVNIPTNPNSILNENINTTPDGLLGQENEERNRKRIRPIVDTSINITQPIVDYSSQQNAEFQKLLLQNQLLNQALNINKNNNNGNSNNKDIKSGNNTNGSPTNITPALAVASLAPSKPNISSSAPSLQSKLSSNPVANDSDSDPAINFEDADKETQKKLKHQLTDRQRRAKIKESLDALKSLVPLEPTQKADQATLVANSVVYVQTLKDELLELKAKIKQLELGNTSNSMNNGLSSMAGDFLNKSNPTIASPYSSMIASLNGAGVSMWRVGLDGKIIEVNMVFEMISGFSGSELVGKSACSAPLYGSLSIMPQSFLRHFSTVSSLVAPANPLQSIPASPDSISFSSNLSTSSGDETPNSNSDTNKSSSAASSNHLFGNSISQLPIVPQSELQSFFPYKHKSIMEVSEGNKPSVGPQPHGQYLINHLANLPPNHVLKLLSRVSTSYGDTLESIVTIALVRSSAGAPDYVLVLSTPDARRLVKPTNFLRSITPQSTMNCNGLWLAQDPSTNIALNTFQSPPPQSNPIKAWN